MIHTKALAAAVTAILAALPVHAGLYSKSSPVIQVDSRSYNRLIAQSNYTSIVEFYAPWCGHCKNLQPAYEKAAKSLNGLAKVAAIDCDDESNKAFCGSMGVQGFPTLKIVKPGSKPGRPLVEDYQGGRTAKDIVEAVSSKIPNLVKRVDDKSLEKWLAGANETAKAVLFSDKGKTSSLLKAVAIEFKGSIEVAQVRNTAKEKATLELFGIDKFPTLLLLPGGAAAEGIVYNGDLSKEGIVEFLSQAAVPNPDPAPAKIKEHKSKDSKKNQQGSPKPKKHAKADATEEVLDGEPSESPQPIVKSEKPVVLPEPAPLISALELEGELLSRCLGPKTSTCILVLVPDAPNQLAAEAVRSLSEVAHRHRAHQRSLFPFHILPEANTGYGSIKDALGLENFEVVALNTKRGWWRALPRGAAQILAVDISEEAIERWVDSIKLGEGVKQKLPEGLVLENPVEDPAVEEPTEAEEKLFEDKHDEL